MIVSPPYEAGAEAKRPDARARARAHACAMPRCVCVCVCVRVCGNVMHCRAASWLMSCSAAQCRVAKFRVT